MIADRREKFRLRSRARTKKLAQISGTTNVRCPAYRLQSEGDVHLLVAYLSEKEQSEHCTFVMGEPRRQRDRAREKGGRLMERPPRMAQAGDVVKATNRSRYVAERLLEAQRSPHRALCLGLLT